MDRKRVGSPFSHPKNFAPVCTTELGTMAGLQPEFDKRNCKIIGLSVDPVSSHHDWVNDIEETEGHTVSYPMIGDPQLNVAKLYGMLPADAGDGSFSYPMSTGRNFDEILRVLDSLQLTARHQVSTPANWKRGDDVIISGSVSNEEARKKYPGGWKAPKPYLRIVPEPK